MSQGRLCNTEFQPRPNLNVPLQVQSVTKTFLKKPTKLPCFFFLPNFPNILPNHFFILLKIMDGFVVLKCGGLLVALQTTETVVPSSNPASLTVKNSEDRQGRCVIVIVYCNISGQRGETSHLGKKKKRKKDFYCQEPSVRPQLRCWPMVLPRGSDSPPIQPSRMPFHPATLTLR